MKNVVGILIAFLTLCFVWGCGNTNNGNANNNGTVQPLSSPTPPPAWSKVSDHSTCEAMNPNYCLGYWGFSVTSDGHYLAGPDSSGNKKEGTLTADELNQLNALATADAANFQRDGNPQCDDSIVTIPGTSDHLTVTLPGGSSYEAYQRPMPDSTHGVCYRGGSAQAQSLHDYFFNTLLVKYYPNPFPNGSTGADRVTNGAWGGDHVSLDVTNTGATVNLDCARGDMKQPLVLDGTNNFGDYGLITQTEGPLRLDHPHVPHPTQYSGAVNEDKMALNIRYVDDDGQAVNVNYNLSFGKPARFAPCPL